MAGNDESGIRLVTSGHGFEIWKGPKGTLRLDWTRRGAIRLSRLAMAMASSEPSWLGDTRRPPAWPLR